MKFTLRDGRPLSQEYRRLGSLWYPITKLTPMKALRSSMDSSRFFHFEQHIFQIPILGGAEIRPNLSTSQRL